VQLRSEQQESPHEMEKRAPDVTWLMRVKLRGVTGTNDDIRPQEHSTIDTNLATGAGIAIARIPGWQKLSCQTKSKATNDDKIDSRYNWSDSLG
jgi:hypothetical protein